jgi:hypothetical protein
MAFGEVDGIRELNYLLQEIGPCAKTLDDAGDLLPSRSRSPKVIGGSGGSSGFGILSDSDFGGGLYRWWIFRFLKLLSVARHPDSPDIQRTFWYVPGKTEKLN